MSRTHAQIGIANLLVSISGNDFRRHRRYPPFASPNRGLDRREHPPFSEAKLGHLHHMGDQQRVTFRFGENSEVQYLRDTPERGDHVRDEAALWVVASIEYDGLGALVTCEPTRADVKSDEHARRATL